MTKYGVSSHAREMMRERRIEEKWVRLTLENPDHSQKKNDGTVHYVKAIGECEGRFLRVVVNPAKRKVVTLFFDRAFKRRKR